MRILSICPRVHVDSEHITAVTSWLVVILSLGMLYRKVIVDPTGQSVSIQSRYLWCFRRHREISFSEIREITHRYDDMSPDSMFSHAHDSLDWFTVGLRLHDDSEITLFNFLGEGTFSNNGPLPDWMYVGESAFDVSGSQEDDALDFVQMLRGTIGVDVFTPRS